METISAFTQCEESEFLKEKLILSSLMYDGIITDIEYRLYASGCRFVDRRAAILEIMLSKYKQDPKYVLEMCKRLTAANPTQDEDETLCPTDPEVKCINNPLSVDEKRKNPLLNNAVLQCMFDFAPLKDLKKFRLVCRQWNFIAEPLLRKKSRIHLNLLVPKQLVTTFEHSLPDLPFTSFRFSSAWQEDIKWDVSDLQRFLDKWGNNTKELHLDKICSPILSRSPLDISSLLANTLNLTKLTISSNSNLNDPNYDQDVYRYGAGVEIQFETLITIKFISLTNCTIVLPSNQNMKRGLQLVPSEITLDGVRFKKVENNDSIILTDFRLNDFIDFSRTKIINVTNRTDTIFDMKAQIFKSQYIRLKSIRIANLRQSRGNLEAFHTSEDFLEAIKLEIKELRVTNCGVDLCVLPRTVRKLHLEDCSEIICNSAIQLPELQFACFQLNERYFELVSRFAACQNLVELEIAPDRSSNTMNYDFDVQYIPRSVKRMKITCINLVGRNDTLDLDTLIVQINDHWSFVAIAVGHISKMKSKVNTLVVSCIPYYVLPNICQQRKNTFWNDTFCADSATAIIRLHKIFGRIVIGLHPNYEKKEDNDDEYYNEKEKSAEGDEKEGNDFSNLVDKKANYYIFQSQCGKALPQEEFKKWIQMNNLKQL